MACRRSLFDVLLFAFLLVFAVVFLRRHLTAKPPTANKDYDDAYPGELLAVAPDPLELPSGEAAEGTRRHSLGGASSGGRFKLDPRVAALKDVRSAFCRDAYPPRATTNLPPVSVIIDFSDYQFYDVKNTLGSLVEYSNWDLIDEVLVVDDASTLDYIREDSMVFIAAVPKARIIRGLHVEPAGMARSRAMAVKQARAKVLVFLDSRTLVTPGWLDPLVELLANDTSSLAVPHHDVIRDPVSLTYKAMANRTAATFSWNLAVRMRESGGVGGGEGDGRGYSSPVVRGNVFAVRREFFESVGGYDEGLEEVGGEHLELSLRVWLCGGTILVVPCSRVGIVNLNDPVRVTSQRNILRLGEMWFGERKTTLYRTVNMAQRTHLTPKDASSVQKSIGARLRAVPRLAACRPIDWYLEHVAPSMLAPSADAVRFGVLRIRTGRCAKLLTTSRRVKLDECHADHYNKHPPEMVYEMNKAGQLRVTGKCLTVKDNAYIVADECIAGERKQEWRYLAEQLVNVWSNYCAMHVTDPDPATEGDRQIMMAQECGTDNTSASLFKQWEFIAL